MEYKSKTDEFHYYYADLIDRFNRADLRRKLEITEKFPYTEKFITEDKINSAYMAGVVEELCRRDGIRIPEWTQDKKYFLDKPHYGGNFQSEKVRTALRSESPEGFRKRRIFVSSNAIVRV